MKPRKRYKPRGVNPLAHLVAIQGASMLSLDDRIRWAMQIEDAINAVQTAQAETGHWTAIFDAVNLVEQLVLDGFAKDTDGIVNAAQEAVVAIMDRRISTGVKAARASELKALRTLAGAWSDLMDNITHQQRFASEERLYHRLRKAMRTKDSGARFFTP